MNENVIEFLRDAERATATFTQGRFKNKIRELAKEYPDECEIVCENDDGSMVAHIPVSWVRVRPPRIVDITEERKEELRKQLEKCRAEKNTKENANE